ncbi:hypothetical protein SAMN04487906_2837 [Zhouia amylolytica]|uniref:histidine kinase n=2 Tax=Zhouia amylolytica TaxID=376730 RepID=A0A1I6V3G7_9FLAO|nr:two-component regulator propeller domain-containing protein [Zhouia amylolytica]SFT08194.1 hypothetical protein SAMN04487906_2837 [Zhouia amylolytica]
MNTEKTILRNIIINYTLNFRVGWIVLILLISSIKFSNGQTNNNFKHLNKKFNLTSQIETDANGYIWITDLNGIYKFDGYDYIKLPYTHFFGENYTGNREVEFEKDHNNNFWLASRSSHLVKFDESYNIADFSKYINTGNITSIASKAQEEVWFGSNAGNLYSYDYQNDTFKHQLTLPKNKNYIEGIVDLTFTTPKMLWISTTDNNIYSFNLKTKELIQLETPINKNLFDIIFLTADQNDKLWIATEQNGLLSYDPKQQSFKQHDPVQNNTNTNRHTMFRTVFCDSKGIIWAGTDGDGVFKIDPDSDEIEIFKHQYQNKYSLSNNTIRHIDEDHFGNHWIVVKGGIVNILANNKFQINYFSGLPDNTPTRVLSVCKSNDQTLWIGTDGEGLTKVLKNGKKINYNNNQNNELYFPGRYIQKMTEDEKGNLWIATYQNGLHIHNPKSNTFKKLALEEHIPDINVNNVLDLYIDSKNRIWVYTLYGIHVFDSNQNLLANYSKNSNGLKGAFGLTFFESKDKTIWISVIGGGVFRFHENDTNLQESNFKFANYRPKNNVDGLPRYNIYGIVEDGQGNLWFNTGPGYLIRFDPETNTSFSFRNHEKLKNINIKSVEIDTNDNLWLSSEQGIHKFNSTKESLESFYEADGLQGNQFIIKSSFKSSDNTLFFGGINGVNSFDPNNMIKEKQAPKLFINEIEILNKPVHEIISEGLPNNPEEIEKLTLTANQSSFSFRFSAIYDVLKPSYVYAYRLKGFNDKWITAKDQRIATYTNIPSGNYTFEVKAGNNEESWNIPQRSLDIRIKPFWWQTNVAYALYLLLILSAITGVFLWYKMRNRLIKEEWQYNQEKELYAMKMNFFAKMSHEIQTPLTLILAPLDDMFRKVDQNNKQLLQRLKLIKYNAQRLSRITTELTTIRNKELNQLKIHVSKQDIKADLQQIALSYSEHARIKNIDFIWEFPDKPVYLWYDIAKLEHIIYNLLSNAFKLTPIGGQIILRLTVLPEHKSVEISVIDSGPGIPEDEISNVFNLFYQAEAGKKAKGLGVGLALCKELIDLHHGQLEIIPMETKGAHFKITLSTNNDLFENDDKVIIINKNEQESNTEKLLNQHLNTERKPEWEYPEYTNTINKNIKILIVEDNTEMQLFLQDLLAPYYTVLTVENGLQGLKTGKEVQPDIIISDIMMPEMDGIEMAKKLLKIKSIAHIPIILLTAKNATESKILGLSTGAISYIHKPFNPSEILVRIENLIKRNNAIISKLKVDSLIEPTMDSEKTKDILFIEKLTNVLNEKIDDPQFKLENLTEELSMSYSVIYKKCQEITGKNLKEYFRKLKLKKAAMLILNQKYRISEASYMVGYNDAQYFTRCFKQEFGLSPSELKKMSHKKGIEEAINYLQNL